MGNVVMYKFDQSKMPLFEALKKYKSMRVVPFDVPGHKRGRGNKELTDFLGENCMSVDVNSMKPLDNLCHQFPLSKKLKSLPQTLLVQKTLFMINGTTSAVQSMILYSCKKGEKLLCREMFIEAQLILLF